jgi:hypothetical protein
MAKSHGSATTQHGSKRHAIGFKILKQAAIVENNRASITGL